MKTVKAWHFVGKHLRDYRPVPADGEVLVHDGPVAMCESGLHASKRLIDALEYAPGNTICRVEMWGDLTTEPPPGRFRVITYPWQLKDKLVARRRMILWRVDGEQLLRDFTRRCALDVVHLWRAPDVVIQWLRTGDESLRPAAWDSSSGATPPRLADASWDATWSAAQSAAPYAIWPVAAAAARAAARSAAHAAAQADDTFVPDVSHYTTTLAAARARQNRRLTAMVVAQHRRGG
jgi:hypothetical protein